MPLVKAILNLSEEVIDVLDVLKKEYGVSSRAKVLEKVVEEFIAHNKSSIHRGWCLIFWTDTHLSGENSSDRETPIQSIYRQCFESH